ncbi:MAG: hypothetical protein KAR06_05055, partial [Deltaproteobacteria bacterium]|nr:hypothetical protein [Deltaproteobacteria bacterium]
MKKRKKTSNKRKIADRNPGFSTNALTVISIVSLVVISIIAYGNTLSSSFHLDDFPNIVDNYKIRDISNFFHVEGRRYFGYLSFAANYELSGLSVAGFHITNTAIHITNTLLVFALTLLLFKTPALQGKVSDNRLSIVAALFASAVFAAHPVNTQAVTYIVQRFTSLSTLFYLASITLFILTRLRVHTDIRTIALAIASTLMAVCAMMTKEISFTIPFMVILIELFFFGSIMRNKKRLILFIPLFLTVLIIPLSIIGLGKPTGDILGEISKASQETDLIGRGSYFLTELRVIVTYLRLFILPIEQNLDYDYVVRSGMDVPIFLSALLHVLLIGGAIYLFIRSKRSNSPFGLLASSAYCG